MIKDKITYDESSPTMLRWEVDASTRARKGSPVGSPNAKGYIKTSYKGKMYFLHRLVWEIHHGVIPEGLVVDHRDGDKSNNLISNLRLATKSQNAFNSNSKRYYFNKAAGKWRVFISIDKKQIYCGSFDSEELAAAESDRLQKLHYGEFKYGEA